MSETKNTALIKSNVTYDFLKQVAQLYLPALATLYFALAQTWGLPAAEQVMGTVVAVDTFLGVVLHISNLQYENSGAKYGGTITVEEDDVKRFSLNLDGDPDELENMKEVTFKIDTAPKLSD